jgi:hypothetical protein
MNGKATIAIAAGDPPGIGPEISFKVALDPARRDACNPIIFCDPGVIEWHANACGIKLDLHVIERVGAANWSAGCLNLLACAQPEAARLEFGTASAAGGSAVVAAPQNQPSISLAGIQRLRPSCRRPRAELPDSPSPSTCRSRRDRNGRRRLPPCTLLPCVPASRRRCMVA